MTLSPILLSGFYPNLAEFIRVARMLKKLRTSKGDYLTKQWFSSVASLFKMGTSLKERICSQSEQILSYKSSSLYGKSVLPHEVMSLEW